MAIEQLQRVVVPVSQFHTVTPGQTLQHIATIHGVTPASILVANPGRMPGGVLIPGTRLHIPGKSHPNRIG